jgi:hypothetical protein
VTGWRRRTNLLVSCSASKHRHRAASDISLVITPSSTLPLGLVGSPLYKIATGVNPDLANEVGWPGFVNTVGQVVATVPAAEHNHTIVLTEAYQQAGALELLRPANGVHLPPMYSSTTASSNGNRRQTLRPTPS